MKNIKWLNSLPISVSFAQKVVKTFKEKKRNYKIQINQEYSLDTLINEIKIKMLPIDPKCTDDYTIARIAAQKDGFVLNENDEIVDYIEPTFCANYNRDVEETNQEERKEWLKEQEKNVKLAQKMEEFITNRGQWLRLPFDIKNPLNATLEGKFSYLFKEKEDSIVEAVRQDLLDRSKVGIKKYNTTLDRTDLSLKDWLQHAYEEGLDQVNYLKRAIIELEKQNK